jgi:hypothetical protein
VVWFDCLYNSLKRVWTRWRTVVPRHQFIIDSRTVRTLFSKCHKQLQIKNSGGNLYTVIHFFFSTNLLSKYSSSGIWSLPSSHKQDLLPNRQLWTCFRYDICQETEVCAKLSYRVWTQSLVQHAVAQICMTVFGALYISPAY